MTTGSSDELAATLQRLETRWSAISRESEVPHSLMDVIEYGLGDQRRAEVYVNRLLCYLLDPDQPHGMGADFLGAFLEGLPRAVGFDEDTFDLSTVHVDEQVQVRPEPTDDGERSPGFADLVLGVPNEWFLLVELKFAAPETGTESYCAAPQIGDHPVEAYESGQYYLFLHQADRPTASGDCFANWTWREFVADLLDPFVAKNANRYPQRTVSQLHDLRYDLREITSMTDHTDVDDEKIALYLEHADAIEDLSAAFEDAWEAYGENWGRQLAESLDGAEEGVQSKLGGEFPEVTVERSDGVTDRWLLRSDGGDWQHFVKDGWYRHEDDLRALDGRADDRNDLRIGFYHRMGANRDKAVRDRELEFNFRCMGSNPTAFSDVYERNFDARQDEIRELLTDTNGTLTGQKLTLITSTYEIDDAAHDGFFEAYTAALHDAFIDLVVENPKLIEILDDLFEESIEEFS